jgi:hypothetical protein
MAATTTTPASHSAADAAVSPTANRRRRGMLGGLVLVAIGATFMLPPLGVPDAILYLFLALGIAFALAYLQGLRPTVYLVPAAVMLALGMGLLVPTWFGLPGAVRAGSFLAALAVAFAAVFLIHPSRRWPLVPAAVLAVVSLAELFGKGDVVPGPVQPFMVPLILIAVGVYLVVAPRID